MSLIRFKRSVTDFIRGHKKTKHVKACKSVDEILLSTMVAPEQIDSKTANKHGADESSYLEALSDAYHEPETLDIRRSLKYGLDSPPQVSAVYLSPPAFDVIESPQSPTFGVQPVFEPSDAVKELAVIPRTPLLRSTPVFEDSPNVFDVLASPCTPSLTCSTPYFSSPTSDVSTASLVSPRVMKVGDFELIDFLSKGSCGQVYLARDSVSDRRLALKVIKKVKGVWNHPLVKEILMEEKKIMASLQGCDWFVQLEASWHDTKNIYLAMMYHPTDLESELIKCERFSEERARFYMIELIIALEDLHKRGIVHRDVKMANILISADGHIALADFGLSKDFGRRPTTAERSCQPYWPYKTDDDLFEAPRRSPAELTFVSNDYCGSEMEMAPEVVRRDFYSFGVDFWSAGIALYAMVTGRHPWSDDNDIPTQILDDDIRFHPEDKISEECKDFIWQVLQKEPGDRLRIGMDMTSHPFFAGVDWEAMKNRTVSPPWVPDCIKGHFFFEDWGTIEHFEPGCALDKDEEDVLPGFVFVSPNLQQIVRDDLEPASLEHNASEDFFCRLFRYGPNDDVEDDEALCNYEFAYEAARPLSLVDVYSPLNLASESHASMSPSFHSATSLVYWKEPESNVDSTSGPTDPLIDPVTEHVEHVLEVESLPEHYSEPEPVEVNLQVGTLTLIGLEGSECLVDPLPEANLQCSQPIVSCMAEPVDHSREHDFVDRFQRTVPKLLQFATLPVVEPISKFAKPAPFQPVLEPVMECVEALFDPMLPVLSPVVYMPSKEPIKRETRAIRLYSKVVSWLEKLLRRTADENGSTRLTFTSSYEDMDMTFWESVKWKVKKLWTPRPRCTTRYLQRKRTILC